MKEADAVRQEFAQTTYPTYNIHHFTDFVNALTDFARGFRSQEQS